MKPTVNFDMSDKSDNKKILRERWPLLFENPFKNGHVAI